MGCCLSLLRRNKATVPKRYEPTLVGLSTKIRARICEYSVIHDEPLYVRPKENSHQPAIARVCRELRELTLPSFYNRNDFIMIAPKKVYDEGRWQSAMPPGLKAAADRLKVTRGSLF